MNMHPSVVVLSFWLTLATGAAAQESVPYTYLTIAGDDTLASEVVTRGPSWVEVSMIAKSEGLRHHFTMTVAPDESVTELQSTVYRLGQDDSVPAGMLTAEFRGDSVYVEIGRDDPRTATRPTGEGAIPWIKPSSAIIEQVLRRAQAMDGATDTVPLFNVANGQTAPAVVTWLSEDSARVDIAEARIVATLDDDGVLSRLRMMRQQGGVIRLEGAQPLILEEIDYGAPPDAPYTAEEVTVRTPEGLALSGTLTLPESPAADIPAIVTITGSGQQDRDERLPAVYGYRPFWQIADTLGRRGIATLRLDDRGTNDSDAGPSGATAADFAGDIRAALDYLRDRPEIDGARLGLVGHSEGGMIAPMVAATDSSLSGIVLMAAPGFIGRRVIETQRQMDVNPNSSLTPEERAEALERGREADERQAARDPRFRFIMEFDPAEVARRVQVPVLILHGETDRQVTAEQADTLAAAFRAGGNDDVTVRTFPDVNHLFLADSSGWSGGYARLPSKDVPPEVLGAIADWLAAQL